MSASSRSVGANAGRGNAATGGPTCDSNAISPTPAGISLNLHAVQNWSTDVADVVGDILT